MNIASNIANSHSNKNPDTASPSILFFPSCKYQNAPANTPARKGVCRILLVRRTGWRGGRFGGASLLSSLIGLSDDEGNYFLRDGQGQT